jgi:anion-transporting  ArsA/GET3 family ATPase
VKPRSWALARALAEKKVLIVCGSGGVGKTTTAAALALEAAGRGRRVLVCTIDPARRLATSLGLDRLRDEPRRLDLRRLGGTVTGALYAMALDTKRTFDALVERHAGDEEARRRILENPFYKQVSSALAGTHEYMAMEKLLDLVEDERFDLVVLDTPPTRHALDFLEAPNRLLGFLDSSILRWVLRPYFVGGRLALKVATRTGALALKIADRVLGLQFLQDLSEFFLAFEGMYEGFKERAARVHELLRRPTAGFVLVASPAPFTLKEALYFRERLREAGMPFVATLVNRVHEPARPLRRGTPAVRDLDPDLARKLIEVFEDQQAVSRAESASIAELEEGTGGTVIRVAELEADVHDIRGLAEVAASIFRDEEGTSAPASRDGARAARAGSPAAGGAR